jgi:hypothetical protein
VSIRQVAGPALERKGDIAAILTALAPHDVLFIDEIHRLNRTIEEILYPALEDFRLDIIVGQGPAARTLTLDLPPFTLVGATTRTGLLTTPLRDRFGLTFRLDFYDAVELAAIVRRSARILELEIDPEAAQEIAQRARGTPRIANRILRRVRDVAQVRHAGAVSTEIAAEALELLEIDHIGLERFEAAGRSASRRSPSPSARRPRRSRTSTSPTCCSAASCSGRRAGACSPSSAVPRSAPRATRTRSSEPLEAAQAVAEPGTLRRPRGRRRASRSSSGAVASAMTSNQT